MTFFGLKQGQDLENRAAHPHEEFRRGPPGDLGLEIRTPPTSFTSASHGKDVSMVTSECVIELSEKGTQTSAKCKRRLSIWAALVRERNTKMQFYQWS